MKIIIILLFSLILSSCQSDWYLIQEKWSPIDSEELKTYPIKNRNSFAIGVIDSSNNFKYIEDHNGKIYEKYNIGDTIIY